MFVYSFIFHISDRFVCVLLCSLSGDGCMHLEIYIYIQGSLPAVKGGINRCLTDVPLPFCDDQTRLWSSPPLPIRSQRNRGAGRRDGTVTGGAWWWLYPRCVCVCMCVEGNCCPPTNHSPPAERVVRPLHQQLQPALPRRPSCSWISYKNRYLP